MQLPIFTEAFREAVPYLYYLRQKTLVITLSQTVIESPSFTSLAQDIAVLYGLGIRLVVIFGTVQYELPQVISTEQIQQITQTISLLKRKIEASLTMGFHNAPHTKIAIVSSNFIYAKPRGVIDGCDYQFLGSVRRIDHERIQHYLDNNSLILMDTLAYSPSGNIFYLPLYDTSAQIAYTLQAEKLIFMGEQNGIFNQQNQLIHNLTADNLSGNIKTNIEQSIMLEASRYALQQVKRVHIISGLTDGSLLDELFTRDGVGTSLAKHSFTRIRPARSSDIPNLLQLIDPLVKKGILLARSKSDLEKQIEEFIVLEFDEVIYGCASLHIYEAQNMGELACLAVSPQVREQGYGEDLLYSIIEQAKAKGLHLLFALSTQTAEWFLERGFTLGLPEDLPPERFIKYQQNKRQSKIFMINL